MNFLEKHFTTEALFKVAIIVFIFLILMTLIKAIMRVYFKKRMSTQSYIILSKVLSFLGISILLISIISQLGFSSLFTTALGTAGIAGVAIGFASKTSLENIISGVLLLSDKSFKIDDIIYVDGVEGTVVSIDSLSVKIQTYDNQIVRVPNVKILNSDVTNLYPKTERRRDFYFKIAYTANLSKVETVLKEIAQRNPYAIKKEDTFIYFYSFEDIGLKVKYGVWFEKGNLTQLCNSITKDLLETFQAEGIEMPVLLLNNYQDIG